MKVIVVIMTSGFSQPMQYEIRSSTQMTVLHSSGLWNISQRSDSVKFLFWAMMTGAGMAAQAYDKTK